MGAKPGRVARVVAPFTYRSSNDKVYTLYKMAGDAPSPLYFFSQHPPKSGTPVSKPEGYRVTEHNRSHLPLLKKS